ncbi:MAG TPA: carboxymuconolactone decarboxylase family protein [Kofleriaceae bacterium]|jgi:alkylhydroperoxidase family enzyme|nr:carboxymuconolactone decarboxylase family protein [Kofleriaceae bacterium]
MPNRTLAMLLALAALCAAPALADRPEPTMPTKTMSRSAIPYKPDDDQIGPKELVDAIRARRPGGKLLNLDRILLHSPNFARGWNGLFAAVRGQLAVPAKLRELSIMAIGVLNQADYEWAQHEKEFLQAGGTAAQLAALKNPSAAMTNDKLFDEAERATLALTDEMTRSIKVSDATMKRIRKLLPLDQVVELIGTIASYNMVSRFLVATGVELESRGP